MGCLGRSAGDSHKPNIYPQSDRSHLLFIETHHGILVSCLPLPFVYSKWCNSCSVDRSPRHICGRPSLSTLLSSSWLCDSGKDTRRFWAGTLVVWSQHWIRIRRIQLRSDCMWVALCSLLYCPWAPFLGQSPQQLIEEFRDIRYHFNSRYVRLYGACDREGF